ncbi:uncharacterized protein LOC134692355 [Mytilus trossulus]|uniref:uncharacterized protein LOC134692355 n=1 Tax=Mytilus trossulus TaxID=6551 RepID=UPI00300522B8
MASALPVLSREETNFRRVANLLIRLSPKAVRILFDREFNPSGLKSTFSKNWTELDKLKKNGASCILQVGSDPRSNNFDLTLMVCLLRNLTKVTIQDQLPQPADMSEGAAVSRIKYYRNQIAHSDSGTRSDADFKTTFDAVSKAIEIICPTMKSDCTSLENADLDNSFHDIFVEFVKKEKEIEEIYVAVETLNLERNNIQSIQTEETFEWKKKLEKFYVTEAATRLFKVVKENQCTIITGVPGSGKSAVAYHVAIYMQETEGYTVVPIWLPSDFIKFAKSNSKYLFVFDDVFGKYSLNEFNLNCWDSETIRIKMFLKNKLLKVMVTCRSYLYDTVRDRLSSQSFKRFNLQSDEMNLSFSERKEISKLYLTDDVVSHLNDETVMLYNFFPLLCVMFKEKNMDNADFFQNPNQFIQNEIENFKGKNGTTFIALALLVLSNNSIEKAGLQIGNNKYNIMLQDLFDVMDNGEHTSKTSILSNLRSLKNMYLRETESIFCTKHDKGFDIISHSVANFIIPCIIRHGDTAFISSRCQLKSLDEEHGDCTILIRDEFETMYFERIQKDIDEGYNWEHDAFLNNYHANGYTPLHCACIKGHKNVVKLLLQHNAAVNEYDKHGQTPLDFVIGNGHTDLIKTLTEYGADVNFAKKNGRTPIYKACQRGYLESAQMLLFYNADVTKCNENGWSPLYIASYFNKKDIVALLCDHSTAVVNQSNKKGRSPLHIACREGYKDIVILLLKKVVSNSICDINGYTPLHFACSNGHKNVTVRLIKDGAPLNEIDKEGQTPLFIVAKNGDTNLIRILAEFGADVNIAIYNGITPIISALWLKNLKAAQMLISYRADVNKCADNGWSPLHYASYCNEKNIVQYLCYNSDAIVNLSDKKGKSPLHIACEKCNKDIVSILLQRGATYEYYDKNCNTPFHLACNEGNTNIAKQFIKRNAPINYPNSFNESPFYIACKEGHRDIVELLIEHGAEVNMSSEYGWTPLHVSVAYGITGITCLLLENSASANKLDNKGRTPLYYATYNNYKDNKLDNKGRTPLYYATYNNYKDNKLDNKGRTPLYYATYNNYKDNKLDNKGRTPLYYATYNNYKDNKLDNKGPE